MRLFIFSIFIICLASCNAQKYSNQEQHTFDTLKLFNPYNSQDGIQEIIHAKNAITLQYNFYAIIIGDKQFPMEDKTALSKFLSDSAATIRKKRFHILVDSSKSFKEIAAVIDLIKAAKIDNYQVFNLQTGIRPPEVLSVLPPTSVSTHVPIDSSWLLIKFEKNIYKISLLEDSISTSDINMIDKFFGNHLDKIDQKKLLVSGSNHDNYQMFHEIKKVFKKYNFPTFRIVTNSNQQEE